MGTMTIDGRKVEFTDEKNVLTVIRKAGINIPTLCYHSEVSTFGACRLCTVEDDRGRTFASCFNWVIRIILFLLAFSYDLPAFIPAAYPLDHAHCRL